MPVREVVSQSKMESLTDFLRSVHLFRDLLEPELLAVARIAREFSFEPESVIAYQRDVADQLYIVREGRLDWFAVGPNGQVTSSSRYMPTQYFNDAWLFEEGTHDATVRAASAGRMLIISGTDFVRFLEQNPGASARIEGRLSEYARDELQRSVIARQDVGPTARITLLPDELIEYESLRSGWLLFLVLAIPIALVFIIPFAIFILLQTVLGSRFLDYQLVFAALGGVVPALYSLYRYYDWANDYLVITNRRLIHREFELSRFRIDVQKIPIDQVQSISTIKPGILQTLFDVGTLKVTTAATQGGLTFDFVQNPTEAGEALDRIRSRKKSLAEGRTQQEMRQSLEDYFGVGPQYQPVDDAEPLPAPPPPPAQSSIRKTLTRLFGYRIDDGKGTITYRRHWLILLKHSWLTLAILGVTLLIGGVAVYFFRPFTSRILLISVVPLTVAFLWFLYAFDDWRNDVFQLTPRTVIDIDRGPLGFSVSRKEADLANVQNVRSDKPGFVATILGFGNVYIDTAGQSAEIVFEDVVDPNKVQSDIFERRERIRRQRNMGESEARRREIALMLDVYKQAVEQNVLPDRTPSRELEAEESDDPRFDAGLL